MSFKLFKYFICEFLILVSLISCVHESHIEFDTGIDTKNKPINYLNKDKISNGTVSFSSNFLGSRLSVVTYLNDSVARVFFTPENEPINSSPYFAFEASSILPKAFYFIFKYPEAYSHRYIPKIKKQGVWNISDSLTYIITGEEHKLRILLDQTPVTIAAQKIESSVDVKEWIYALSKANPTLFHRAIAGKSKLGKNIEVLDLYKGSPLKKEIIVLLTRQHPPEISGYYAFQTFLSQLTKINSLNKEFFEKYRIIAFPLINPDGVDLGHWRHNAGGVDLNRDWSLYRQPEVKAVVNYINKEVKKSKGKVVIGLDFHSTWNDVFYTNTSREKTTYPNFEKDWFEALESKIPNYKVNEKASDSKTPTSKGWFLKAHNATGITFEIGDETPIESINLIASSSAIELAQLLINYN